MIHVHPFPARMAPEIALSKLTDLPRDHQVLDPMSGSGMVLSTAARLGLKATGYDLDPLACMISKVAGTKINEEIVRDACTNLMYECDKLDPYSIGLPWIDDDEETRRYIEFWFATEQIEQLRKLGFLLVHKPFINTSSIINVLQVAVSRLIITKEPKASLARDTAHSRPHRTITENDFDVISALPKSLEHVISALSPKDIQKNVTAYRGDARKLGRIKSDSVDCIVTSPPYFNAIDYMRGHKLSLVWFGNKISKLRRLRSRSVGAEIGKQNRSIPKIDCFFENLHSDIDIKKRNMLRRYFKDLCLIIGEAHRVLKSERRATYVIGNSRIKGHEVKNIDLLITAAEHNGFKVTDHTVREIPESKRYLPMLSSPESALAKRMKMEHVVTLYKQ